MSSQYLQVKSHPITVFPASLGRLPEDYGFHPDSPHGRFPVGLALTAEPAGAGLGVADVGEGLDCLVSRSSSTPLLVLALVLGDTALYFVFNPLDTITRNHLEEFERSGVFPFLFCDDQRAMPYAARGSIFKGALKKTEGRTAPAFADWLLYARGAAVALPGAFEVARPDVTCAKRHQAFVLIPDEYLCTANDSGALH